MQPQKIYVTHLLKENFDELWNVISEGGHIYVCGYKFTHCYNFLLLNAFTVYYNL